MTTPTQAQIDAVKKRIKLAAPGLNENIIIHTARTIVTELAALTAAAQVGEQILAQEGDDSPPWAVTAAEMEAATIERCAQALQQYMEDNGLLAWAKDATAAIRKLKDEA